MSNIIPNSNLPASSQPWGREIQKRLQILESEVARQKINNNSDNSQIQSSYKRLDETVSEISQLSEVGSEYKVNVDNLVGERYKSNGIDLMVTDASLRPQYPGLVVGRLNSYIAGYSFFSGIRDIDGTLVGFSESSEQWGLELDGISYNVVIKPGLAVIGSGGLTVSQFASGGTTGASIDNNGRIIRTPSSEKYKQDIEPLEVNYEDLLSLEPKRFKLKSEASEDENARYYAGFIAEEIAKTSLTDFVAYATDEDGNKTPDGVYYAELSAALLTAIKHQDKLIKSLTERVEALENRDKV
jgi:hypothetical protein